eukprot:TRINITY_DN9321_c1_g2_i2.p1 TRINITY_DN9321_c1_g2~~TRINITY_DN9321_c1_g2_i2.p1  ORF type:complete len:295 (-),score=25.67 TRINITY_DN9321_c1_g2_i2:189-962(-)
MIGVNDCNYQIIQVKRMNNVKERRLRTNIVYATASVQLTDKQIFKDRLRAAVQGTNRGACTGRDVSGEIEEALINVEQFGEPIDDKLLEGKWKLIYTTAPDVVGLLLPGVLLPLEIIKIENIYQEFGDAASGKVDNVIRFSIPGILREGDGGTLRVNAGYQISSRNTIKLTFLKGSLGELNPTETLESILVPAMLPRGQFNQQLLLGLKEFKFEQGLQVRPSGRVQPTGDYLLTYMDEDMLIGRAINGKFVFDREVN